MIVEASSRELKKLWGTSQTVTGKTVTKSKNTTLAFKITLLSCAAGIFKLSGHWQPEHAELSEIDVQTLHMMASDGWEELNLSAKNTQSLVVTLLPELRQHLEKTRLGRI